MNERNEPVIGETTPISREEFTPLIMRVDNLNTEVSTQGKTLAVHGEKLVNIDRNYQQSTKLLESINENMIKMTTYRKSGIIAARVLYGLMITILVPSCTMVAPHVVEIVRIFNPA